MNTTTDTIALATEALNAEGIDAYFPNVIPTDFYKAHQTNDYDTLDPRYDADTYISALALYLDDNPDRWHLDDETFDFDGDLDHLASYVDTSDTAPTAAQIAALLNHHPELTSNIDTGRYDLNPGLGGGSIDPQLIADNWHMINPDNNDGLLTDPTEIMVHGAVMDSGPWWVQ